jgi:hypothetical protein
LDENKHLIDLLQDGVNGDDDNDQHQPHTDEDMEED